ncbi:MAG TPA: class I SAM-dependent methyltransferase [Planctomycetota bacterium]|nr:class I SAM-dependent methyltransferase [Planctomycetota bacterium]
MRRGAFEQFARLDQDHWWFRGRRAVYLGLLEQVLAGARPARALDLGCGPGGFLPGLARLCERVVAADSDLDSLQALAWDQRVLMGAHALPFADRSFDLVTLFDVIEHLDDDLGALREVNRVLGPKGLVAVSVPAYPWLFSNNDRVAMHRRRYTRKRLAGTLEQAGFEVLRNTHANVLLTPVIVPLTLVSKAVEATPLSRVDSEHTNLSWPLPRFAHHLLARVFASELALTRRFDAPFGHSIAAIARRR